MWDLQNGSNTECSIAFALETLRRKLPHVSVLDLRKAYDCVARNLIMNFMDEILAPELSTALSPLLWHMTIKTKRQKSDRTVITLVGMPKGDPPNPILFTFFIDSYIRSVNTTPSLTLVSLFVDKVLMRARTVTGMKQMLRKSDTSARSVHIKWLVDTF